MSIEKQGEKTMEENWNDYDFVMQKVKEDGMALMHASEELKNNLDIVIVAIKQEAFALFYARYCTKVCKILH